jgi:hypothetical protein
VSQVNPGVFEPQVNAGVGKCWGFWHDYYEHEIQTITLETPHKKVW